MKNDSHPPQPSPDSEQPPLPGLESELSTPHGDGPGALGDGPGALGDGPGSLNQPPALPGAPGGRSAGLEGLPRDVWRDRIRVIRDGVIYAAVAIAAYKLRMVDKLDPATAVFLLLIAGVRAQNIADFVATRGGRGGGAGGLAGVAILGIPYDTFRGFFRG